MVRIPNLVVACAMLVCVVGVRADVMDNKASIFKTVPTHFAGTAEITCDDPQGWTFDVSCAADDGRDVVTVRLARADDAPPPRFGVFFRVPGADVQNVWTSDHQRDGTHLWPRLWWGWKSRYRSALAYETPLAVGFNAAGRAPVALACSEAMEQVEFGLYAEEKSCDVIGRCEFFTAPVVARRAYAVKVLFDRRGRAWDETVRACSQWVSRMNGFVSATVPEAAFDPLYSTWYAYLQDVQAHELEREASLAASVGMKTMILDDGWQKAESKGFYSATGDWQPAKSRFPDMKAHVAAVHDAGLKYMLWLSVPFMGREAANYARFKKMLLYDGETAILDPRFPEVRAYLIETYARVVGEWGFDGVKLDFIDSFTQPKDDPALKDNYAGRDYRSVPEAVDRLMKDVRARLAAINPDVLIEFRQRYMGPAMLQYGNMIRAADCPADPTANRRRICDLRLTSGDLAVHSDMLVWNADETPEGAALPILNALFSTIQYSMVLSRVSPAHRRVIAAWIRFTQEHRAALLKGSFRPHHPELGYPWIEGECTGERVIAVYASEICTPSGALDRDVYLVNATGRQGLVAALAARPAKIEIFDVFGEKTGECPPAEGFVRLEVPSSGYVKLTAAASRSRPTR